MPEAYCWSNLTSGNGTRALWLLLLPFMVVNLAHWMRPDRTRPQHATVRALRPPGAARSRLTLTVLLVAAACEVALDLAAWQCAGTAACAERQVLAGLPVARRSDGGWWSSPGRRLALAALVPAALTGLLWYLSHRTWSAYESQQPMCPRTARTRGRTPAAPRSAGPASGTAAAWSPGCAPRTPPPAC